ncbi:hypothetical protein J1614_009427 [Plenodomus biglobosus]|nr:hypothetical protein J1614_009427 [Plenodomus biglobosus]
MEHWLRLCPLFSLRMLRCRQKGLSVGREGRTDKEWVWKSRGGDAPGPKEVQQDGVREDVPPAPAGPEPRNCSNQP